PAERREGEARQGQRMRQCSNAGETERGDDRADDDEGPAPADRVGDERPGEVREPGGGQPTGDRDAHLGGSEATLAERARQEPEEGEVTAEEKEMRGGDARELAVF